MKIELQQRIAHNLTVLRQNAKLSQSALASQMAINRTTYCQYELGERLPDVVTLQTLCKFYHVNMDTVLNSDVQTVLREYFLYQEYTREETKLLALYNSLSDFSKGRLVERAEELAQLDRARRQDALLMNG
ncbi:MAG: helix-turn-helix transcriptional regulator [Firmicutes bacterium]|jgi:transcriptional regulator with XRE-family HTH domain|nr:helix-turn-helix transcriptional regulator [Bacillota bacterium]NBI64605.1 XRE family transcriptional regulator [Clostridiales bacterium]